MTFPFHASAGPLAMTIDELRDQVKSDIDKRASYEIHVISEYNLNASDIGKQQWMESAGTWSQDVSAEGGRYGCCKEIYNYRESQFLWADGASQTDLENYNVNTDPSWPTCGATWLP